MFAIAVPVVHTHGLPESRKSVAPEFDGVIVRRQSSQGNCGLFRLAPDDRLA